MPERDPGFKDSRKQHAFSQKDVPSLGIAMGGAYGGISYGVTRLLSNPDLASKVGIGVGVGIGAFMAGIMGGITSGEDAKKLAIQGKTKRAKLATFQGILEAEAGMISSGVVSGYEIDGARGAIIGGAIGVFFGSSVSSFLGAGEAGRTYREVIHPALNPQTFSEFNVVKDVISDDEDLLVEHPPVYVAGSIGDMMGFRKAQVDFAKKKAPEMKRIYKHPENLLLQMRGAIFIIPDIIHYPAFDPENEEISMGGIKLKQPSRSVKLNDQRADEVIAKPYDSSTSSIWPYTSELEDNLPSRPFDEKRWQYWRGNSWRHDVVILATRKIEGSTITNPDPDSLKIEEEYHLIDILAGGEGKGDRIKKKDPIKDRLKSLVPVRDPQQISRNTLQAQE